MTLVLDASVTLSWCFDDERTPTAIAVLEQVGETYAWVPSLWRYEVANGLVMAQRRKRIDDSYRERLLEKFSAFDIRKEEEADLRVWGETIVFANTHRLSVYNASYLELAYRRRLPLATMDAELAKAAAKEGLMVLGIK